MPRDDEGRRSRNAKRLLWMAVLLALLLGALIAYTSLNAPGPHSLTPNGALLQG